MAKRAPATSEKKAVGYIRVSTTDQALGPDAQRAQIEAWAAKTGIELVSVHVDLGMSGGSDVADRPGLVEALRSLELHAAGVLVVAKRDRLARDVFVAATAERMVARVGARVVSADGTGAGEGPEAALMRNLIDSFAAYERALIRARTTAALGVKRARGERAGNLPFGRRVIEGETVLGVDDREALVLERARALRAEGKSLRAIVAVLAEEGFTSRTGRPYCKGSVEGMLRKAAA